MNLLKKHLPILIAAVAGVLIGAFVMGIFGGASPSTSSGPSGGFKFGSTGPAAAPDCKTTEEMMTVSGESLAGIVKNGEKVKVIKNYYACKDAQRGDIVVYGYAGGTQQLVKIVKAIPGDKWELKQSGSGPSTSSGQGWNILVNGAVIKTSDGKPYFLGNQQYRLLSLYAKDYGGAMPPNTHLILGNEPGGSLDSTRFGLVDKSDFLGKVAK